MDIRLIALGIIGLGFVGGQAASLVWTFGTKLTLLDWCVGLSLLLLAWRGRASRRVPGLSLPIAGFSAVAAVSLLVNGHDGYGWAYFLRWILYAIWYVAAARSNIPSGTWWRMLRACGVTIAVLGLIQIMVYPDLRNLAYLGWDPHYRRLFSTLLDPNFTGLVLVLTVLSWLPDRGRWHMSVWDWVGMGGSAFALMLTFSRGSFIAFAAGLVFWGVRTGRSYGGALAASVFAVVLLLIPRSGEGQDLFRTASSMARMGSASVAVTTFLRQPLFGSGFSSRQLVTNGTGDSPTRAGAGIDTSILFVAATTGIAGLISYGWLLVSAYGIFDRVKSVRYLAGFVAIAVHSLGTNSLFYPWIMVWIWALVCAAEEETVSVRGRR